MSEPGEIFFIQVEPTTRCNFSCCFCAGRHLEQGDLSFNKFQTILKTFKHLKYIELQGEGEPLLHPQFFEMCSLAQSSGISVSTITNGSLLTGNNIRGILRCGIESLFISLETSDPDEFRQLRGGDLDKIVAGIRKFVRMKQNSQQAEPLIGFAVTMLKNTINQIEDIFILYRDLGLDGGFIFQPLQTMYAYSKHYSEALNGEIFPRQSLPALDSFMQTNKFLMETVKKTNEHSSFYRDLFRDINLKNEGCPWLIRGLFINKDGELLPCCRMKDSAKYSFGKIAETEPAQIYNKRNELNIQLVSGRIPPACIGCTIAARIAATLLL